MPSQLAFASRDQLEAFLYQLAPQRFLQAQEKLVPSGMAAFLSVLPLSIVVVISLKWQELQQMRYAIEILCTLVVVASVGVTWYTRRLKRKRFLVYSRMQ
ncbi:MAG: hypothetical protein AAFO94_16660 [Bacteroidota bacterium]